MADFLKISAGTGVRISTEVVKEALGPSALEPANDFKLTAWLGSQEDQHQVVVYQAGQSRNLDWFLG